MLVQARPKMMNHLTSSQKWQTNTKSQLFVVNSVLAYAVIEHTTTAVMSLIQPSPLLCAVSVNLLYPFHLQVLHSVIQLEEVG